MADDDRKQDRGSDRGTVRAAGCVLWRRVRAGADTAPAVELCLVHRPAYDDWSYPKGKLKRGEDPLAAALREVLEETGHRCAPGAHLDTVHYTVAERPKQVDYWAAEDLGGVFAPNDEVDRIVWLSPEAARGRLTQPRDRGLVDVFVAILHTI